MQRWNKCPRCEGLLHIDRDLYGWYVECLMCGFNKDLAEYRHSRRYEHQARGEAETPEAAAGK